MTRASFREPPVVTPMKPPSERVADMDAETFFTYFVRLLASNPPATTDADIMTDLVSMGVVPGPEFDFDALDPAVKDMLSQSVGPAQARILSSAAPATDEDITTVYLSRARKALVTLAANMPVGWLRPKPRGSFQSAEAADESEDSLYSRTGSSSTPRAAREAR